MKIKEEEVEKIFLDCLYDREIELSNGEVKEGIPKPVVVRGIQGRYGFHPDRLEKNKKTIKKWLSFLPYQFRNGANGGGGWSFLNSCFLENKSRWTDSHRRMDQLLSLGQGVGLVKCLLPRELWFTLPSRMPYFSISL